MIWRTINNGASPLGFELRKLDHKALSAVYETTDRVYSFGKETRFTGRAWSVSTRASSSGRGRKTETPEERERTGDSRCGAHDATTEAAELKQQVTSLQQALLHAEDKLESEAEIAKAHLEASLHHHEALAAEKLDRTVAEARKEVVDQLRADVQRESTEVRAQAARAQAAALEHQEKRLTEAASENLRVTLQQQKTESSAAHESALASELERQKMELTAAHEASLKAGLHQQKQDYENQLGQDLEVRLSEQEVLLTGRFIVDKREAIKKKEQEMTSSMTELCGSSLSSWS